MSNRTTVSVALASHQGARFIDEQLESLASQTRLPDQLVVSDDASSDDTVARAEAFAQRAPFAVQILRNGERLGTTPNFGRALTACDQDITFFADQDDIWRPRKIEAMVDVFDAHPETGAVLCNADVVDEHRRPLGYDLFRAQGFSPKEQQSVRRGEAVRVFMRHVVAAGNSLAFRTRYMPLVLPIPPLRSIHDAWTAFLVAAVSDFELLDEDLVEYRLHGENQFGLALLDLRAQIKQARLQIDQRAFEHAALMFEAVAERLDAHPEFPVEAGLRSDIEAKARHARLRDAMPGNPLARWPQVFAEAARGHYGRYGYGWKSLAQDLFLR